MVKTKVPLANRICLFVVGLTWVLSMPLTLKRFRKERCDLCYLILFLSDCIVFFKRFRALVLRQVVRTDKKTTQRSGDHRGFFREHCFHAPCRHWDSKEAKFVLCLTFKLLPWTRTPCQAHMFRQSLSIANQPTLVPSGHQPLPHENSSIGRDKCATWAT